MNKKMEIIKQEEINFKRDQILVVRAKDGDKEKILVAPRKVCENLRLDWSSQRKKLIDHPVFSRGLVRVDITTDEGTREILALELDYLPLWLANISPNKVAPENQDKLIAYQLEVKDHLYNIYLDKGYSINKDITRVDLDKLTRELEMLKLKRLELARWAIESLTDSTTIDKQFIERSKYLILAEATNQRVQEAQEVNLEDFLRSEGIRSTNSQLISFGKVVAEVYRGRRKQEPKKVAKILSTGERLVNYYTTEDLDILEEGYKIWANRELARNSLQ